MSAPARPAPSRERILGVATELFGRHGFDAVTTRQIAAASGLNVATVAHHVGGKGELYTAVFTRAAEREAALLDAALADRAEDAVADPARLRALLHELLDAYLDLLQDEPALAGLWTRRWLERGSTDDAVEERLVRPLLARLGKLLDAAARAGSARPVDAELLVRSVLWTSYGWFTAGLPSGAAPSAADVARLRAFLSDLLDRVLGP